MQAVLLCRLFRLLFLRQVLLSLFGNFSRGHHSLEDQGALFGLHMQQPGNLLAIGEACLLQIVPYGRRLFLRAAPRCRADNISRRSGSAVLFGQAAQPGIRRGPGQAQQFHGLTAGNCSVSGPLQQCCVSALAALIPAAGPSSAHAPDRPESEPPGSAGTAGGRSSGL